MGYISTWLGDPLSALLMSLMALQLALANQNPFWPCFIISWIVRTLVRKVVSTSSFINCEGLPIILAGGTEV